MSLDARMFCVFARFDRKQARRRQISVSRTSSASLLTDSHASRFLFKRMLIQRASFAVPSLRTSERLRTTLRVAFH